MRLNPRRLAGPNFEYVAVAALLGVLAFAHVQSRDIRLPSPMPVWMTQPLPGEQLLAYRPLVPWSPP